MGSLKSFSMLAVFLAAPFLIAKGVPCGGDRKVESGDSRRGNFTEPHYTIEGQTLKTLGFTLQLKQAWIYKTQNEDGAFYVYLYRSPDRKRGVLSVGCGETRDGFRDLWLIDFTNHQAELLDETGGSFASVVWRTDRLFEITWGGLGYWNSIFLQLGKERQEDEIDDPLDVDVKRGVYAAVGDGEPSVIDIEVGRLFKKDVPREKFEIPNAEMDGEYLAQLQYVGIEGNKLVVCFDKGGKGENVEKMVFYPELLK